MHELSVMPVANPVAELPPREESAGHISMGVRIANLIAVILPLAAILAAAVFLWGWGFHWFDLILLVVMYVFTALGITVGFHRLFTHRSFDTYKPIQFILGVLGSMAVEGPLITWVGMHRRHHQYSDRPEDPHTPHHHGHGVFGVLSGAWHAHIGWLFDPHPPDMGRYVKDLERSRMLRVVSALFPLWVIFSLALPALLGWLVSGTWVGAVTGFLWGGLMRIFLVHHVTWSVNSVCHLWGAQPYETEDQSRNNVIFGVLGMGEGWHATHHAFPTSARHGLRWWQIDVSYYVIRLLQLLGLAWNVKIPSKQAQLEKRRLAT
jgi:stearoyl-CoA desaturase (delta-9 desaturase)